MRIDAYLCVVQDDHARMLRELHCLDMCYLTIPSCASDGSHISRRKRIRCQITNLPCGTTPFVCKSSCDFYTK